MAHEDCSGIFDDYLHYLAVSSAHHEFQASVDYVRGDTNSSEENLTRSKFLKNGLERSLQEVNLGLHDIIGDYGVLVEVCPEAREFLEAVVMTGNKLYDSTHKAYKNTMSMLLKTHREKNEKSGNSFVVDYAINDSN